MIDFLHNAPTLRPLGWKPDISLACRDHVSDISPKGIASHVGSDGSNIIARLNRYGRSNDLSQENISFGRKEGRAILINLLIDDDNPSRNSRTSVFTPEFKFMGCFSGTHKHYDTVTCINYTTEWRNKEEEVPV